jgi:hypothetical protein
MYIFVPLPSQTKTGICKPFKEPRNLFPAWQASTTTLFVVPVRQATYAGKIDSSESILRLYTGLQIRAQAYYKVPIYKHLRSPGIVS